MKRKPKVTLVVESPAGDETKIRIPYAVAFAAARGIARETHSAATLLGRRGTATFNRDGGGVVEWNEQSGEPGAKTKFTASGSVSIY